MNTNRKHQQGFTLIELMIVVAIIGVLASIAISSYQTYTIRAQVTEGIVLAGNAKVPIVDAYLTMGAAPANREEAGLTADSTDTSTKYVKDVAVVNGRLDVTFGNEANTIIADTVISLTPYETPEGSIVWRCGDAPNPANNGSVLSPMGTASGGTAAAFQSSSVGPEYMPSSCR